MTDDQLRHELTVARNRLGNAIGAIIDSGGYCTGPQDVAAAIARLAAERDALRTAGNTLAVRLLQRLGSLLTRKDGEALAAWREVAGGQ